MQNAIIVIAKTSITRKFDCKTYVKIKDVVINVYE